MQNRRARLLAVVVGVALFGLVLGVAVVRQALHVRSALLAAQSDAADLARATRDGDEAAADEAFAGLRRHTASAASGTGSVTWRVAGHVPLLGRETRALGHVAVAAELLAVRATPPLRLAGQRLAQDSLVQHGRVDLPLVAGLAGPLAHAQLALADAEREVRASRAPRTPFLRARRADLLSQLEGLRVRTVQGGTVARLLPGALGDRHARRYLLVVQNDAEARATGGLVGAYAVVVLDQGRIRREAVGSNSDLVLPDQPLVRLPEQAQTWQVRGSTRGYSSANLTPHFPDTGRVLAALWKAQSGKTVDGVLAVDPETLEALVRETGPLQGPEGALGAGHVADYVRKGQYAAFPAVSGPVNDARKRALVSLAEQLVQRLGVTEDGAALLRAGRAAVSSGRLFAWSSHRAEQQALVSTPVAGALPRGDVPYLTVLSQNLSGNKIDPYLTRAVEVLPLDGQRLRVTVRLGNEVPAGLPGVITNRADRPRYKVAKGESKVLLSVYGAGSSAFSGGTLDGRAVDLAYDVDHGHPFVSLPIELAPGARHELTLVVTQPPGVLVYRQQPLASRDALAITAPHRVVGRPRPRAAAQAAQAASAG